VPDVSARFDGEQLATLAEVVRQGSFDAAARALHVTPSAVSQRVKALEVAAGQVLVRRARPTTATPAGEVLVRLAGEVELLEREARAVLGDGGPVTLALAVNADSLSTWFPEVLVGLPDDVLVDVHRADQDRTADLLRDGAVMAAVTADRRPVQGCSVERLGAMRYHAVATPDFVARHLADAVAPHAADAGAPHAAAAHRDHGRGPARSAWARAPHVAFDRHDALQDRFLAGLGVHAPVALRHLVATQDAFLAMVRAGRAWGMVPEQAVVADLAAGDLVLTASDHPLDVPLYWQRWKVDAALLATVTDLVRVAAAGALRPLA
jgi:LysR family transcriptional regulator (chromosome initiation inhibitor)